ncbi:MAG: hypothetical protein KC912_07005 [Proteobacteria bacterium]|nr:hypothetical protein [Pseudomonadota bacterium]
MHDPPLDYDTFGKRFMDQYCAGCHSTQWPENHGNRNDSPLTVNFDTYAGVVEWAERAYIRTYETGDMPPGGGPTDQDLVRFNEWMQCEVFPDAGVEL